MKATAWRDNAIEAKAMHQNDPFHSFQERAKVRGRKCGERGGIAPVDLLTDQLTGLLECVVPVAGSLRLNPCKILVQCSLGAGMLLCS